MSCQVTTNNYCFLKEDDIPSVILKFSDISQVSGFKAAVKIGSRKVFELDAPVINGNDAYFDFSRLNTYSAGTLFSVHFSALFGGKRKEFYLAKVKISDVPCSSCNDAVLQPFTVNTGDIVVNVGVDLAIVNFGDGAGAVDAYTKAQSDAKYQQKGDYALKSEIPTVPSLADYQKTADADSKYQAKGDFATNAALNIVKATVDANAYNIAANTQAVSLNTQNVAAMQAAFGYKADKSYVDNNFVATATANANYAAKSHTHSWNEIADRPTLFSGNYNDLSNKPTIPNLAGYATESWANGQFQPKGSYLTATDADNKYQPKGSYLTSVSWADVGGKPASYPAVTNQKDGSAVKVWYGTQSEYDAILTKDSATLYFIS